MKKVEALIDWWLPVIVTAVICWIFWHDVRVTASNGWGWLLIASTFLAPMAAAYWCGREHGRRRRGVHLPGPNRCLQCNGHNDNRERGLALCEDCREGE